MKTLIACVLGVCVLVILWQFRGSSEESATPLGMGQADPAVGSSGEGVVLRDPVDASSERVSGQEDPAPSDTGPVADTQEPGGSLLEGHVEDLFGQGLGQVQVVFAHSSATLESARCMTDALGRFSMQTSGPGGVIAVRAGYEVRYKSPLVKSDSGAWQSMRFCMGPVVDLDVLVQDPHGSPIGGETVTVALARVEREWNPFDVGEESTTFRLKGTSDNDGKISFVGVPAHLRLELEARTRMFDSRTASGRLAAAGAGEAVLRLQPDGRELWTLELGRPTRFTGKVLEPDGSPSPKAAVLLRAVGQDPGRDSEYLTWVACDDQGRFSAEAVVPAGFERILVVSYSRVGGRPALSPFGSEKKPDPLPAGWLLLHEWGDEITVPLSIMPKLGGRVVDSEGQPVPATVIAHPQEQDWLENQLLTLVLKSTGTGPDGTFEYLGVPPGLYDLQVLPKEGPSVWLRGVHSGNLDCLAKIGSEAKPTVTVRVHCDQELKSVSLIRAKLEPFRGVDVQADELGRTTTVKGFLGAPPEGSRLHSGFSNIQMSLGNVGASYVVEGRSKEWSLRPGLYWLAAKAYLKEGGSTFPVGTGLVRVEGGRYEVDLHLPPAGSLEGRIQDLDPMVDWCVALAGPDGEWIPVAGPDGENKTVHKLPTHGGFRFALVPAGRLELHLGTRAALLRGQSAARYSVEVHAGKTARLP